MIEAAMIALFVLGFLLLLSGGKEKKRSPVPHPIKPPTLSEDYAFDSIIDLSYKLSDDTKRRLIKHLARQLKRSRLSKVK